MMLKQRYETGLEKLDFAASQVSVMQQELKDLQPELVKTSAETEKLLAKIEQDTVEVEAKKEVWNESVIATGGEIDDSWSMRFSMFSPKRDCNCRILSTILI